jgi:long-chain acyl-CoA synthetase
VIALSSGTTGTPKSIPQTHDRAILTACLPTTVLPTADLSRVLVFAGANLSVAMGGILHQLIGGRTAVLCSDLAAQNFYETVARDRPTHVKTTTGNANQLVAHAAKSLPDSREKCQSLQGINVGGSPVSPSLRAGIEKYICANLEINYGGSEVNRIAQATAETFAAQPQSAGRVRPWVDIQTVDEDGTQLPAGERGVLRVRSPLLVTGYVADPQTTARAFQDGWFYPGDTGVVDEAGYLTLSGRVDDLLNLGGNKVDPFTIESILDAQPGVEESAALAVQAKDGSMVLVAVVVAAGPIDVAALRGACAQRLRPSSVPSRIVTAKRLIRNPGGKIMRKEMAKVLAASDG